MLGSGLEGHSNHEAVCWMDFLVVAQEGGLVKLDSHHFIAVSEGQITVPIQEKVWEQSRGSTLDTILNH